MVDFVRWRWIESTYRLIVVCLNEVVGRLVIESCIHNLVSLSIEYQQIQCLPARFGTLIYSVIVFVIVIESESKRRAMINFGRAI